MLNDLTPLIQKLTEKKNLTTEEARLALNILTREDLDSYFYFVFTAALHTKGETSDELLGFYRSLQEFIPQITVQGDISNIIDVSGTGGAEIKRMNVDTASTFILRSKDARVAKQSFMSVTGITGSADLLQAIGVDPIKISYSGQENIKNIFEKTGIVTYAAVFLGNPEEMKGTMNWITKRQKIGLNFISIYHLAANAYSVIPMKHRVYGVFDSQYLHVLAELFQKLGYERAIVCCGMDGLDEMSNVGLTKIIELNGSAIKEYVVSPEDLGVKKSTIDAIRAVDKEGNIKDFIRVIYGKEKGPKRDLVAINAGAAFYVLGIAENFKEGTKIAIGQLDNGEAAQTLENYVKFCGDPEKLENLKRALLK